MYYGTTWWMLVLGRMSVGVVAGVAQMVAGSYMTEISPVGIRGSVGVCSQVGIVIGIAFANFLTAPSFEVFGSMDKWRLTFLVPSLCSLFQLAVLPFCPESPSFLIKKGGSKLALATLNKLHRAESAAMHMNSLRNQMSEGGGSGDDYSIGTPHGQTPRKHRGYRHQDWRAVLHRRDLLLPTMMFVTPTLSQMATTLLSLVNLAMTFIAMAIMEKAGRRALIMTTWVGMCTGFAVIFCASTLGDALDFMPDFMANLQVVAMVMIIISFAVGVGNVEGFIISEIMPVYAKDTLMSIGQPLNWIANLTVSTAFPILFAALGRYTYLIFVALTAFFGWFTYFKLPESKGKTVAQIQADFDKYY